MVFQRVLEFGRAGRDGKHATATIIYRKSDIHHANVWIWNNLSNKDRCQWILLDSSSSWRFTQAHLAGLCRWKILLQLFSENFEDSMVTNGPCVRIKILQEKIFKAN